MRAWNVVTCVLAAGLWVAPAGARAGEGLRVKGEWRIEVRNADGTTAAVREFRNAYTDAGLIVPQVLAKQLTAGAWRILLGSQAAIEQPCVVESTGTITSCVITEPTAAVLESGTTSKNLTITVLPLQGPVFRLSGSHVVNRDGVISRVSTSLRTCLPTESPFDCTSNAGQVTSGNITQHDLPATQEIPVQVGQQVLATVTISVSSSN
jgi:hypothetical protein